MLETVVAAVEALLGTYGALRNLGRERREKLASLCDAIAEVLEQYSSSPADRRRSINLCAQLRHFVRPLRQVAVGATDAAKIEELAEELDRVCEVWSRRRPDEDVSGADYESHLDEIAEAAGDFRGFAIALRTS